MPLKNKNVVAVAFDRLTFFEMGIAVEVFGLPRPEVNPWYQFSVCSPEPGPLRTIGGMSVNLGRKGLGALRTAGTIVIPGWRDVNETPPEKLLKALQRAHKRGARLVSFCSGAFVLAAAGLLDHRDATTHWRYAEQLSEMYPDVRVDPNVLYVDSGNVLTAAGSAAGLDLCLHLVRRDFGAATANIVARRLVVPPHREGGQSQFIHRPVIECEDDNLAKLLDWLAENLAKEHTIQSMAKRTFMSPRTFARRFKQQTGTTPARWLAHERVKLAQQLLESTELQVERLAKRCGFGSAQLMRFHFQRVTGQTPTAYRLAFRI
jgi:AraC family transcriptional activator FtrA